MTDAADKKWGFGNPANPKPFDTIQLHGRTYELLFGEHPHSTQDNNIYARSPSGEIENFDGHRLCWRVEVEESNYLKQSELSGDEIRKGGSVRLYVDGECIYDGFCRSIDYGMRHAREIMDRLSEVAGGDWLRAKTRGDLLGRKVFYDGVPAIVERLIVDQGCIMLVPDGEGMQFRAPVYEDDPDDWLSEYGGSVKAEVTDPKIWWWRK